MSYSAYSSELVLNYLFTNTAVTRPTAWNVALYDATDTELTDANYARQSTTFTTADADANNRSEATNSADITYPAMDAAATVRYIGILDQSANVIAKIQLASDRSLSAGDVFSIPTGELEILGE